MPEPNWISAELHDGLMPWVIGARLQVMSLLANCSNKPTAGLPPSASAATEQADQLKAILQMLDQACLEGRQLMLFIDSADDQKSVDVVPLLEQACQRLHGQASAPAPRLDFMPPALAWPPLPPATAWHVQRIVQQAFANALFHSRGTRILVELSTCPSDRLAVSGRFQVRVSDDGRGFDSSEQFPGHFGLINMRQRARVAGFDLQIDSKPQGGGTCIELRFDGSTGAAAHGQLSNSGGSEPAD